jgi:N utilization substance protein A
MKGMRVQSIIRELRGEKIDIIPYSEETVAFAQKALSPAKVTRVQIVDPESRKLEVIVEDSQLSLAIGKKGQNVRLASKLIGWDIDIKSEEEKRREIEEQMTALTAPTTPLTALAGVGPKTIEKIEAAGITSLEQLAGMTPEQLMEIPGIGEKMVDKIYQAVNQFYEGGGTASAAEGSAETDEAVEGEGTADVESEGGATETAEQQTPEAAAAESTVPQTEATQAEGASANEEVQTELPPEAAGEPAVESELAPEASEAPDAKPVPEKHEEKSSE